MPAAGHHAVAGNALFGHAEFGRIMLDEGIDLLEAAFVEQDVEPLAGGQAALGVLGVDALLAAAHLGGGRGGGRVRRWCCSWGRLFGPSARVVNVVRNSP